MTIPDLIPALPLDLALDCLLRVPLRSHSLLQQVSQSWRALVSSPSFYKARLLKGYTDTHACFFQALPQSPSTPVKSPAYGISIYDVKNELWEALPPIPDYPHGLPLFAGCVAVGANIVVLGGWDPTSWAVLTSVYVYNFSLGKWRRVADMPSARSFFACGSAIVDGSHGVNGIKIMVAGGHDANKNALKSAEMYDLDKDEWEQLPDMHQERDECKGAVMGGGFMVISGFCTDSQGQFVRSAEIFNMAERRWEMVDNLWPGARPPSLVVAFKEELYAFWDGKLMRCKKMEEVWEPVLTVSPAIKVPTCMTGLQSGILVVGYSGGAQPYETFLCDVGTSSSWCIVKRGASCGIVQGVACTLHV